MVTFAVPRPNVIESDEGYSVEVLGRTGLRYVENGKVLLLESEMLAGLAGLVLFTDQGSIKDLNTHDKQRVIEHVRAAFKFRGFDIQIV
jgi:hypothetical protein